MPIYTYECQNCLAVTEKLCKYEDRPEEIECPECYWPAHYIPALIANTPGTWGDQTGTYGVNGYYSNSLGKRVKNFTEARKEMEKKGFCHESDLPKHHFKDKLENFRKEEIKYQKSEGYDTSHLEGDKDA